jgi:cell division protein FtsN
MTALFKWIVSHWKATLIVTLLLVLAIATYSRTDKKLFKLLAAQYQQEEQQAIENRDEELAKLDKEKTDVQTQLLQVQKDKVAYAQKYADAQRRIDALAAQIPKITSPADPDALVNDLRRLGYGSATRSKNPGSR